MGQVLLSLKDAADLEGMPYGTIKKKVQRQELKVVKVDVSSRCGYEYMINLDNLTDKAKRKYFGLLKGDNETPAPPQSDADNCFDGMNLLDLTAQQRETAAFWKGVVLEWRQFIAGSPKEKTSKTVAFIKRFNDKYRDMPLSERTLHRKWKAYQTHGEIALADFRGKTRDGGQAIDAVAYSVFMQWWLDEAQPTTSAVYRLLNTWAELEMPMLLPLPSEDTFYRQPPITSVVETFGLKIAGIRALFKPYFRFNMVFGGCLQGGKKVAVRGFQVFQGGQQGV